MKKKLGLVDGFSGLPWLWTGLGTAQVLLIIQIPFTLSHHSSLSAITFFISSLESSQCLLRIETERDKNETEMK